MCPSLSPERLSGFYSYSVFKSSSIIGLCAVNLRFLAPKTVNLQRRTNKRNGEYIENGSNHCGCIPIIYAGHAWLVSSGK
jgi:hypothetical protein